jgi:hypothetical protein
MQLLQLLFCALLALLVSAQEKYPGPQRTEMEDSREVWKTKINGFGDTLTYRGTSVNPHRSLEGTNI